MAEIDDGGPAFPNRADGASYDGMTLRDWFAGQALAAMGMWTPGVVELECPLNEQERLKERARWAYDQADAMLEAKRDWV